ncbi:hypothetical protein D3C75_642760 [compost metagenome]
MPWFSTRLPTSSAIAPVAAEIIPGLPPAIAVTTAMQKEAYRPTIGLTPARIENAIASGISAIATVIPDRMSLRGLDHQPLFKLYCFKMLFPPVSVKVNGTFPQCPGPVQLQCHLLYPTRLNHHKSSASPCKRLFRTYPRDCCEYLKNSIDLN